MPSHSRALRSALAVLLLAATVLFAVGALVERSGEGASGEPLAARPAATPSRAVAQEGSAEAEAAEGHSEAGEARAVPTAEPPEVRPAHRESGDEGLLGVNPESLGPVIVVIALSLVLAAAVWLWGTPALLLATLLVSALFLAFDLREVAFQARVARADLAGMAALIAALHLGAVALAGLALLRRRAPASPTPA